MQFFVRATATVAIICAASLAGSGTPGFALGLDRPLVTATPLAADTPGLTISNVPSSVSVPPLAATQDAILPPESATGPVIADDPKTINRAAPDQRPAYASLAAAVAAQDMPIAAPADLTCLAGAIYFESKGEPLTGQLAVAHVVINRAASGRFPRSICAVVTQPGQFSFVRGGRVPSVSTANAQYRTAIAVAQVAMEKRWESPIANAMFFHARRVSPGWGMTRVAAIGGHVFYR